jgi:hypothetical protein
MPTKLQTPLADIREYEFKTGRLVGIAEVIRFLSSNFGAPGARTARAVLDHWPEVSYLVGSRPGDSELYYMVASGRVVYAPLTGGPSRCEWIVPGAWNGE